MKIFEWMQNRINGSNGKKKPSSISATNFMLHESCKQEFSDWPQALLAIGTFGNNNLKEETNNSTHEDDSCSFKDCTQEFSLEEVGNLENELNINLEAEQEKNPNDLINEHSEGKETDHTFCDESNINRVGNFYPSNNLVYSRERERCLDASKSGVSKKSLIFLLQKMFVCKSGFPHTPNLFKDPLSTESRMEKILRSILHKKIYPQGSCSETFIKKYLDNNPMPQCDDDDDEEEEELTVDVTKGSKWVKTDSEYIVLEI